MVSLKVVSVLVILCLVGCVGVGVYAAVQWEQQINWAWSQVIEDFTVTGNQTVNYGVVVGSVLKTEAYNVTNTGNVDLTVKPEVKSTGGVSIAWDKQEALVRVGESVRFTLTLQISGEGSCLVTFKKV